MVASVEINPFQPPQSEAPQLSADGRFRYIPRTSKKASSLALFGVCVITAGLAKRTGAYEWLIPPAAITTALPLFHLAAVRHRRWVASHLPGYPGGERWGGRLYHVSRRGKEDGYLFATPEGLFFSRHPWMENSTVLRYDFGNIAAVSRKGNRLNLMLKSGKRIPFQAGRADLWTDVINEMRSLAPVPETSPWK